MNNVFFKSKSKTEKQNIKKQNIKKQKSESNRMHYINFENIYT
jgi:hypothetical protein